MEADRVLGDVVGELSMRRITTLFVTALALGVAVSARAEVDLSG